MSDLYRAIGAKIRELRTGRPDLSQEKLAGELGTTANTVSRWETAAYKPSVGDLERIAKFFGVRMTFFFPDMETDPKLNALMSATGDMSDKDFEAVLEYAQFRRARRALMKG